MFLVLDVLFCRPVKSTVVLFLEPGGNVGSVTAAVLLGLNEDTIIDSLVASKLSKPNLRKILERSGGIFGPMSG